MKPAAVSTALASGDWHARDRSSFRFHKIWSRGGKRQIGNAFAGAEYSRARSWMRVHQRWRAIASYTYTEREPPY
jgi:hypothetical protein